MSFYSSRFSWSERIFPVSRIFQSRDDSEKRGWLTTTVGCMAKEGRRWARSIKISSMLRDHLVPNLEIILLNASCSIKIW